MYDVLPYLILSSASLAGLGMIAFVGLKGWQAWLDLKRSQLSSGRFTTIGDRIEVADLRERIRRLEAIAAVVDP